MPLYIVVRWKRTNFSQRDGGEIASIGRRWWLFVSFDRPRARKSLYFLCFWGRTFDYYCAGTRGFHSREIVVSAATYFRWNRIGSRKDLTKRNANGRWRAASEKRRNRGNFPASVLGRRPYRREISSERDDGITFRNGLPRTRVTGRRGGLERDLAIYRRLSRSSEISRADFSFSLRRQRRQGKNTETRIVRGDKRGEVLSSGSSKDGGTILDSRQARIRSLWNEARNVLLRRGVKRFYPPTLLFTFPLRSRLFRAVIISAIGASGQSRYHARFESRAQIKGEKLKEGDKVLGENVNAGWIKRGSSKWASRALGCHLGY